MRSLLLICLLAAMLQAQESSASFGEAFANSAITGAPYSAEQTSEIVRTLANGSHITTKNPATKVYRDSAGRVRTERARLGAAGNLVMFVEIVDPVAQVKYTLDPVNKVAHKQTLHSPSRPASGAGRVAAGGDGQAKPQASAPSHPSPEWKREDLGTDTIEGVSVRGSRLTTIWPLDSMGNDQPVSSVAELWSSPDLHALVLSKNDDPRVGVLTQRLTNISRTEPPPELFQPPADYSIVEEQGAFIIKWSNPQ